MHLAQPDTLRHLVVAHRSGREPALFAARTRCPTLLGLERIESDDGDRPHDQASADSPHSRAKQPYAHWIRSRVDLTFPSPGTARNTLLWQSESYYTLYSSACSSFRNPLCAYFSSEHALRHTLDVQLAPGLLVPIAPRPDLRHAM